MLTGDDSPLTGLGDDYVTALEAINALARALACRRESHGE